MSDLPGYPTGNKLDLWMVAIVPHDLQSLLHIRRSRWYVIPRRRASHLMLSRGTKQTI